MPPYQTDTVLELTQEQLQALNDLLHSFEFEMWRERRVDQSGAYDVDQVRGLRKKVKNRSNA